MWRVSIATYFLEAMDAPPPNEDGATTKWIAEEFNLSHGSNKWIGNVIMSVRECAKVGVEYDGKRTHTARPTLHAIPLGSPAALIIAEAMVDGNGIRRAHAYVMDWLRRRHDSGKVNVKWWGLSTTYLCYLRMNSTVTVVQKRAQGRDGIKLAWCQVCMGWATQLLVRT